MRRVVRRTAVTRRAQVERGAIVNTRLPKVRFGDWYVGMTDAAPKMKFTLEVTVEASPEVFIASLLLHALPDFDRTDVARVLGDILSHADEFALELPWRVSRVVDVHDGTSSVLYDQDYAKPQWIPAEDADDA